MPHYLKRDINITISKNCGNVFPYLMCERIFDNLTYTYINRGLEQNQIQLNNKFKALLKVENKWQTIDEDEYFLFI